MENVNIFMVTVEGDTLVKITKDTDPMVNKLLRIRIVKELVANDKSIICKVCGSNLIELYYDYYPSKRIYCECLRCNYKWTNEVKI